MNNKFLYAVIIVLVIFVGLIAYKPISILPADVQVIDRTTTVGAASGGDFFMPVNMHDGATIGGSVLATSTSGTATTMKASDLNYALLQVTPNTSDLTYTLPATSTLGSFIPNAGDSKAIAVYNATTTAGIDVIFAAGTGMELKSVGTATALNFDEASFGTLTFIRKVNKDIIVLMANPLDD